MNTAPTANHKKLSKRQRVGVIVACVFVVILGVGAGLLAHYWPFSREEITKTLGETIPGTTVTMSRFRSTYFLHPGATAEGLTFLRENNSSGTPPLITVQKLTIQASYHDLFFRPGYISRIIIDGLHVRVPPRGSTKNSAASANGSTSSMQTSVGEIVSKGVVLEIGRRDNNPLKFEIHNIRLTSVAANKPMEYTISLTNALPPGEVQLSGHFGPWNSAKIGQIPVSGNYDFNQANLSAFDNLEGTLSSKGHFQGRLEQINVHGETLTPDFGIKGKGHTVDLKSRFEAQVNGTNGDVALPHVTVQLQETPMEVRGTVSGKSPLAGKIISLDLSSEKGRVQDILRPFVKAPAPPMTGPMLFHAHVVFPSADHPFYKKVQLAGDFSISQGRFTSSDTQKSVDSLSERSQGMGKNDEAKASSDVVESALSSHVVLSNGTAKFSHLVMNVPGASAQMNGTFNVLNEKIDFHGQLKTDVELSDTTKGIKSLLLKPLDPFFKRKRHKGASIPVEMTGTYSQPHFGMEVISKKH